MRTLTGPLMMRKLTGLLMMRKLMRKLTGSLAGSSALLEAMTRTPSCSSVVTKLTDSPPGLASALHAPRSLLLARSAVQLPAADHQCALG